MRQVLSAVRRAGDGSTMLARLRGAARGDQFRLPSLLIIGAMRAGTTFLHRVLCQHPQIYGGRTKEVGYLSFKHRRGLDWYRLQFPGPKGSGLVAMDATPFDLLHPLAPQRAAMELPGIRAIALLRDPVARALSHYAHGRRYSGLTLSLEAAIDRDLAIGEAELAHIARSPDAISRHLIACGLVTRGRYARQIRRWREAISPDKLLVLKAEAVFDDPVGAAVAIHAFIGLDPAPPTMDFHLHRNDLPPIDASPQTFARLTGLFDQDQSELRQMLGPDFFWV